MPRQLSPAHRAKISAAHRGKTLSPAHRAKLSAAHRGKPLSSAHRAKISAGQKGRKKSAAHRAKISAALQGHPVTAAARGKPLSPAHREKIRQSAVRGECHPNFRHGLYAAPPYPLLTPADAFRWLSERQARLSDVLAQLPIDSRADLAHWINLCAIYSRNASKMARYLLDLQAAQADAAALQALVDATVKLMEEDEREKPEDG